MGCKFLIEGKEIIGLTGGSMFEVNPSISFFLICESFEEIEIYYSSLIKNGTEIMQLEAYH